MSFPTGSTGMVGMQGLRGVTGPARYGYQGVPYGNNTARINLVSPTSSPIYLTPQNFQTYYNITSNTMADDNLTISLPFYNPTYSTATPVTITGYEYGNYLTFVTSTPHNLRLQSLVTLAGLTAFSGYNGSNVRVTSIDVNSIVYPNKFRITPTSSGPGSTGSETGTVTETVAVETTNEAYPTPEQAGAFWAFKNNHSVTVNITFSNGTVSYRGAAITSLPLESGNGFSLLYRGTNGFIIL